MRLYKTFDADLISLNSNGVSVSVLMKKALEYFVKGHLLHFYVPECRAYNLDATDRPVHISFLVNDPAAVKFLKEEIKNRKRAAFLKALVRGCLIYPMIGVFLRNSKTIAKQNEHIQAINLDYVDNLDVLAFDEKKSQRSLDDILKPAKVPAQKQQKPEKKAASDRFGDVADLAVVGGVPAAKRDKRSNIEKTIDAMKMNPLDAYEEPEDMDDMSEEDVRNTLFNKIELLRSGA